MLNRDAEPDVPQEMQGCISAGTTAAPMCVHGLLSQALVSQIIISWLCPQVGGWDSHRSRADTMGSRGLVAIVNFPSPGLARATGIWYQLPEPPLHPPLLCPSPEGLFVHAFLLFLVNAAMIGCACFALQEDISQKVQEDLQKNSFAKPCAWGTVAAFAA